MSTCFVVATDLSVVSRKGAQVAAALAAKTGAELELICAVPRDRLGEEKDDRLLDEVRAQMTDLVRDLSRMGVPTESHVVIVKDVAKEIVRRAQKVGAAMIVIAPQGATGWKKLVFGSVAEKVLRLAPPALLVARPARPMPPTDILAAVDRSPGAVRALRHAVDLATQLGSRLHVLWVPHPPGALVHLKAALDSSEDYKRAKARAMKLAPDFAAWVATVAPEGLSVTTRVEEGDAAPTIISQARVTKSSLIVMGMHSRSRTQELFVGSVARAVAAAAPMSVLLVRARPPRQRKKT
jgi:nucleotide-binding universal stress UspA family protein